MKFKIGFLLAMIGLCVCCHRQAESELNVEYATKLNEAGKIGIMKNPTVSDYSWIFGNRTEFPAYDEQSNYVFKVDLRSADLSAFDLTQKSFELSRSTFDSKTIWPNALPEDFPPSKILELGKDPGLRIRNLHAAGVTGKNVGLAIIDQTLLVGHGEYRDRLRLYEEIHNDGNESSMHGPAVASIAVGKTVGVAPDADLYYIAETHGVFTNGNFEWDLTWLAKSIDRICEVNALLPDDKKIRVISISLGLNGGLRNSEKALNSIKKAAEQNIYTVFCDSDDFMGMYRNPLLDPNDFSSYEPGLFWRKSFYDQASREQFSNTVMIPMDSRCVASPTGFDDYVFYYEGGLSWSVPYAAGVYALACQVCPGITPKAFWDIARRTGETVMIDADGGSVRFGVIINPEKIIEEARKLN